MKLYEKITLYRKKNGLSQEELAEKIGVSRQAVSKWETGDALPEITKLKALADTFNVTVDFLLDEETTEFSQQNQPQSISVLDKYADKIDDCVDNISSKSGTFFKKYGWISGILFIILGLYRTITCVLSILPIFQFSFDSSISGFAIIISIFQSLIGIAFIVGGIIIIKKFKPKRT
ncbi:MAG: helix-turn-helix transcriptional regulator [Ruminococcaceae bacterium]|nr:helix-turn-helix transcriptional regulator [Oscillospiraceae bacterium]